MSSTSAPQQTCVRVLARLRPLTKQELQANPNPQQLLLVEGNEIKVVSKQGASPKTFHYDMCFSSVEGMTQRGSQDDVYAHIGPPLLECVRQGFNGCLLAYGQTGSGKTHTVMGATSSSLTASSSGGGAIPDENHGGDGVLPRFTRALFTATQSDAQASNESQSVSYRIFARYIEVYNEKVFDLLQPKTPEVTLKSVKNGTLSGAREELITSAAAAMNLLREGDRRRTVASTLKNERSSRSHAIFQIVCHKDSCTVAIGGGDGPEADAPPVVLSTLSTMSIVDLAGSERQKQSGAEGQQFREMVNINLSLSTLRRVIQVLHDNAVRTAEATARGGRPSAALPQPPIRESVLTSILSLCFGGNSRTTMVINVSPSIQDATDTLSTLEFGGITRRVVNQVSVNEDRHQSLLREMSEEITRLRRKLEERRMSMRMSVMRQFKVESEATQDGKRSVGMCTTLSGEEAERLLQHADQDEDDDVESSNMRRTIMGTSKLVDAMKAEAAEHIQMCRGLQDQLEHKDVMVAALRHQIIEMEIDFKQQMATLSTLPPRQQSFTSEVCATCNTLENSLKTEQLAHETLVYTLNQQLEEAYGECEVIRRSHLHAIETLASLRNELNVAEDRALIVSTQNRRIVELEDQCAHHMEERLALLMDNHRLRLLAGEGGMESPGSGMRGGGDIDRERCGSTSGI